MLITVSCFMIMGGCMFWTWVLFQVIHWMLGVRFRHVK